MQRELIIAAVGAAWYAGGACGLGDRPEPERTAFERELLADAETRSLASANGATTGYNGLFYFESDDGQQRLNLGGYAQFRYIANVSDNAPGADDFDSGFQVERARVIISGQVRDGTTFLFLPFTGRTGTASILDAWVKQDLGDGWSVQAGQFKLPFFHEWLVSERFIQPVERSTLTQVYASIYAQGVQLAYNEGPWRVSAAYSDGLRTLNTAFTGGGSAVEADSGGVTVGVDYIVFGDGSVFKDLTSLKTTEPALMVGLAGHWQGPTSSFFGTDVNNVFQYTADVAYEAEGYNLFSAFVGRHVDLAGGGGEEDTFGFLAQGGLFVSDDTELFARYTVLIPDSDAIGDNPFNELAVGANYYVLGHNLKLTGDVVYFFDDTAGTTVIGFGANAGTGVVASTGSQAAARLQVQFMF
ncbi:MAG: porin [Planctomycetota bacterium]